MPRRRSPPDATEQLFGDAVIADAPLAARMRPRTLEDFVGQPHLVGPDGALTRVVKPGHRPSLILWGPPGSGKTTLARLLADRAGGTWRQLSAVTSGVADIRMAHAGEWVALTRSEIIAFGSDVRQVAQAAADAGVESPIIYRVPAEEATFYERKPRRGRRFPLARVQASARALGTRRRRRSA